MQIRTSRQDLFALLAILIFTSQACHAHVETAAAGFVSGLLHPVFGIDHLLAMLSVGIVSAQLGGRHILLVPSTFVVSMVTGASLGVLGYDIPFLEAGIALSVILLGTAIILIRGGQRSYVVYLFVAFFGSLHGYAHGLEMPKAADPVYYAGGFLVSTVAIHLLGVGIGYAMTSTPKYYEKLRHMGAMMAGMGLMILINLFSAS